MRQPNILLIMTDQQFGGAMSRAGNEDLHTPAMDALADSGVTFDRAYCTQPLCSPSRSSLLTGMLPHQTGVTGNGVRIDELIAERGLGAVLSKAGYECAYGGKWHLPRVAIENGYGFEPTCGFDDRELADSCIRFLERDHDRPFLLVASFDNPHNICEWARNQPLPWGEVEDRATEQCPSLPANFAIPPYEPQVLREVQAKLTSAHPTREWDADRWRHYRHAYYRLCEKVDMEIGRITGTLERTGLSDDTVVIFTSDHGDGLGAHQWNQKWALYEESARVPLILSGHGVTRGGSHEPGLVSNGLDLMPTICDYAGIEPPEGGSGRSLRPLLGEEAGQTSWRDEVVVETGWDQWPGGGPVFPRSTGRMLRKGRYKYVAYSWGRYREQLFDLDRDPGEMVNLAVEGRYEPVLNEHRERLTRHCGDSADDFRVPR